jgi:uncharacterized delta-60 repeat protein
LCPEEAFGANGWAWIDFAYNDADRANAVVRVPGNDRLYVIGGVSTTVAGDDDFGVACLIADGSPCPDFGFSGTVTVAMDFTPGGLDSAVAGAVLPWGVDRDWRLVVAGQVERAATGDTDFGVALLRPDGSLESDASGGKVAIAFDTPGTDFTDLPAAVAVTENGKILVGGTIDVGAGDSDWGFARLNADLTPDTTFDNDGRVVLDVAGLAVMHAMLLEPSGKIVAVGSRDFGGDDQMVIVRLNADGSPDAFFGFLGQTVFDFDLGDTNDDSAWAVARDDEGRLVMVGQADSENGWCATWARVLADGQPDTPFNSTSYLNIICGSVPTNTVAARAVSVLSDGTLISVIEGTFGADHNIVIHERSASGDFLAYVYYTFDLGSVIDERPRGVMTQPDGKVVIATRLVGPGGTVDFGALRIWTHELFSDGFEAWGSAAEWDSITMAP